MAQDRFKIFSETKLLLPCLHLVLEDLSLHLLRQLLRPSFHRTITRVLSSSIPPPYLSIKMTIPSGTNYVLIEPRLYWPGGISTSVRFQPQPEIPEDQLKEECKAWLCFVSVGYFLL
jgi:hypothetical protein